MGSGLAAALRAKMRAGGCCVVSLRGRCMEPLLLAGDRARVYPVDNIRVGDVALLVLEGGDASLHRVVGVGEGRFVTKGDYSGKSETVNADDVIGVAKEFSLAGGDWVEDPRTRGEIEALVDLSLGMRGWRHSTEAAACRRRIWEANKATRQEMLSAEGGRL